jgi:hypothetical protein
MKILYITTDMEDYLSDGILYGLRMKYGSDVIDFPKKESMYEGGKNIVDYGGGFTLWGLLPNILIDRENMQERVDNNEFDVIVFSDIYRQQEPFSHWTVFLLFENCKIAGKKLVFLDGTDDGKPTVYDALHWGTYFKRENPFKYNGIKIIGLSIPEEKILTEKPIKTKTFARYCQVDEAYTIPQIKEQCSKERFIKEEEYYADLAASKYGLGMKKSGWDTPRFMEYAANWCVPCIYTKGWKWDGKTWYDKPKETHPLGLVDMENCILWDDPKMLMDKIERIEGNGTYNKISKGANDWVKTKTCEVMADYVMNNI